MGSKETSFTPRTRRSIEEYARSLKDLTANLEKYEVTGVERYLAIREVNLSLLKREESLWTVDSEGNSVRKEEAKAIYVEGRSPKFPYTHEVLNLMDHFPEIYTRYGYTHKQLMQMERPYYLVLKKHVIDTIVEEREKEQENRSRMEQEMMLKNQKEVANRSNLLRMRQAQKPKT